MAKATKKAAKRTTKKTTKATKATKTKAPKTAESKVTKVAKGRGRLLVVESPTKARTIGKYLGSEYTVKATVGHLRDLPKRKLGVDVDDGFKPEYVTVQGQGPNLAALKKAAKSSSAVYLATDPDREGEAIAWHVADQLGSGTPIHRVLFHEITKEAVQEALEHPLAIDGKKVDAQQARRILDRLVGYKASPLLWQSVQTGTSAGRVQTVALRLIVEREEAIRKFTPVEYWTIEADLEAKKKAFQARLHKMAGKKPELPNEASARKVVKAVTGKPFVVTEVTRKQRRKRPQAPFTTSTLQQEAAKKLGFSSQRTMRTAQQLYEGIEIKGEGAVGLITYMRTDSTRVADSAMQAVRAFIRANYDKPYLPETPNLYQGKQRTQDAHEAVRPTDVKRRPDQVKKALSADQYKLYQLIWQRFVSSQMMPTVYDTTTIDFDIGEYQFRATGSIVVFDGYHKVYTEGREVEEGQSLDDLAPVPSLEAGDKANVKAIIPSQHFTDPPPRYSEASLVKELERLGIGRPSTYASIVSTLRNREYVTLEQRRFTSTPLGETVVGILVRQFPDIFNVQFTSQMELELDKVEEGEAGWQEVVRHFYEPFAKSLATIDTAALIRSVHDVGDAEKEPCPNCGGPVAVRSGRFGPFIACKNYPECKYTKPLKGKKAPDRPTDEICRECQSPMVIKTGRFGEFLACSTYPKCKHTRPIPLGVKCPKCIEGDLVARRSRKGRTFYGCGRYPECDFSAWNRPVADTCPDCGKVGAEAKATKARGNYRKCLKCGNEWEPTDQEALATADA
ncbi:MAG: type I DNA topoisomerase [Gemmatimonadales bacterium]